MIKKRPTEEEAAEAEHWLENAILEHSRETRTRFNDSNAEPIWVPRRSTFRFSPLRKGGFIYTMDADQQTTAYYVVTPSESFGRVTFHGQDRNAWYNLLKSKHLYPTQSPYTQWYDYRKQIEMDDRMRKVGK